ncbi:MAG: L-2-hydroxyglutarate oxidase [Bacteroidetes Order II. Incertae sedis bacterium]|nr:L-2-hydroxyglutarate oxidase [Bacteroidetes Order II. bacterium]
MQYDVVVVGGGIVGLATGWALIQTNPALKLVILEKEATLAQHQTGRNSGVIHSGIYYKPGSFKAKFARAGRESMVAFAREYGIAHDICGKLIVASHDSEREGLNKLYERGLENQIRVTRVSKAEMKDIEPHLRGEEGVQVLDAGIIDYKQVVQQLKTLLLASGVEIRLGIEAKEVVSHKDGIEVQTNQALVRGRYFINCGGLWSDRIAKKSKATVEVKIVPFRGEYFELKPEKNHLVKNLIYPVPNPNFPFLGVHLTRMVHGGIHAGPNAVLAFKRDGYSKLDFSLRDTLDTLTFPGFWILAGKYLGDGVQEMLRSFSKKRFTASLQALVPEIQMEDLTPSPAGIRAQAMLRNGQLVDDFMIHVEDRAMHVCNAPSPAATASLEIGRYLSQELIKRFDL